MMMTIGSAADGIALLERLEAKLDEYPGQLMRASVELAKMWRQDKALRYLQAELLVADAATTLCVSGNGDVLEAHDSAMGEADEGGRRTQRRTGDRQQVVFAVVALACLEPSLPGP